MNLEKDDETKSANLELDLSKDIQKDVSDAEKEELYMVYKNGAVSVEKKKKPPYIIVPTIIGALSILFVSLFAFTGNSDSGTVINLEDSQLTVTPTLPDLQVTVTPSISLDDKGDGTGTVTTTPETPTNNDTNTEPNTESAAPTIEEIEQSVMSNIDSEIMYHLDYLSSVIQTYKDSKTNLSVGKCSLIQFQQKVGTLTTELSNNLLRLTTYAKAFEDADCVLDYNVIYLRYSNLIEKSNSMKSVFEHELNKIYTEMMNKDTEYQEYYANR